MAMLVLFILPMSFAADVDNNDTADVMGIQESTDLISADNDLNDLESSSDDDALSAGYDYETTVTPSSINYVNGSSVSVEIRTQCGDEYQETLDGYNFYAYFDGENSNPVKINISSGWSYKYMKLDLSQISQYLHDGENTVYFHHSLDENIFSGGWLSSTHFNPLIINVVDSLEPTEPVYVSTPTVNGLSIVDEYIIGDSLDVNVVISHSDNLDLEDDVYGSMGVYVDGNRVFTYSEADGLEEFTFDLALIKIYLSEGTHDITFHPNPGSIWVGSESDYVFNNLTVNAVNASESSQPVYVSTPTVGGAGAVDYTIGDHLVVNVSATYDDAYDLSSSSMFVFVNGRQIKAVSSDGSLKSFTFDLFDIYDNLAEGRNNITFHPKLSDLEEIRGEYIFNNLTVNAVKPAQTYDYKSVPDVGQINYVLGENANVTLTITYSVEMDTNHDVYAYIDGSSTPVEITTPSGFHVYSTNKAPTVNIKSFSSFLHLGLNTVVFHPASEYLAQLGLKNNYFGELKIDVEAPPEPTTIYYVNGSAGHDGSGLEGSVYTTIEGAVNAANKYFATDGGQIIIKEGNYTVNESISIQKNITITADGDVTVTASDLDSIFSQTTKANVTLNGITFKDCILTNAIFYQNGNAVDGSNLVIEDCNFINNNAKTLLRLFKTKTSILGCNFIENTVTGTGNIGGLVCVYQGGMAYRISVSNSNIINNSVENFIFTSASSWQPLTANSNYWGSNEEPSNVFTAGGNRELTLNNWVVLNVAANPETVETGDTSELTYEFKLNTGGDAGSMPEFDIAFSAQNGSVSENVYTAPDTAGIDVISAKCGNFVLLTKEVTVIDLTPVIYVALNGSNTNDGSSDSPVRTIAKAIELANNTKHKIIIREGTYYEHDLNITSALDIRAEGDVVIDANQLGRILYINTTDKVKISGITFKNGKASEGAAISVKDAKVTIYDCEFTGNNASGGAAVIFDTDGAVLTNSNFHDNYGRNSVVKVGKFNWDTRTSSGSNTIIENCTFSSHHGVIYGNCMGVDIEEGTDGVKVIGCSFTNNIGEFGSTHGALYIKGDNAVVDNCLFENNTMGEAAAIEIEGKDATVKNSRFINNTVKDGQATAGAIQVHNAATITGNTFTANGGDSCRQGGAIEVLYMNNGGDLAITNNEFIRNSAINGPSVYIGFDGKKRFDSLNLEGNTFDSNYAVEGAIYNSTPKADDKTGIDYTVGNDTSVKVTVKYDGEAYPNAFDNKNMMIFINGVGSAIGGVDADATGFTVNLADYITKAGEYNISFHPADSELALAFYGVDNVVFEFNNLTVNAVSNIKYESTPAVDGKSTAEYLLGEHKDVSVAVVSDKFDLFEGYDKLYAYVDGVEKEVGAFANINPETVDLKAVAEAFGFEEGKTYIVCFHLDFETLAQYGISESEVKANNLTVTVTGTYAPEPKVVYNSTAEVGGKTSVDYTVNQEDEVVVNVTVDYDESSLSDAYLEYLNSGNMLMFVNGEAITLTGISSGSKSFTVKLNDYKDKLAEGKNSISFHPRITLLESVFGNEDIFEFNNLTVNVAKAPEPAKPTYNVTADSPVEYTKDSEHEITVSIAFDDVYANADLPIYLYFGEAVEGILVDGVRANDSSFVFDLKTITDKLSMGKNTISFHPDIDNLTSIAEGKFSFTAITVNVNDGVHDPSYITTPDPNSTDYTKGESQNVTVNVVYDEYFRNLLDFTVFVYINGEDNSNRVEIEGVLANDTSFEFDLKTVSDKLADGENTLTFHPHVGALEGVVAGPYTFNTLTVNVNETSIEDKAQYVSTPTPNVVDYDLDESLNVSVSIVYNESFAEALSKYKMYVYINGEDNDDRVEIEGVKADATSFEFDLKRVSDKFVNGANTLTFHPNTSTLTRIISNETVFNTLTVNVVKAPEPVKPTYNVTADSPVEYSKDSSHNITVTVEFDDAYANADLAVYVFVDNASEGILVDGVKANDSSFEFDLNAISDKLTVGNHVISFHPDIDNLTSIAEGKFNFTRISVYVNDGEHDSSYTTTPVPNATEYTIGESQNVTVNVVYDEYFKDYLDFTMYVYINGEDNSNRVEIEGVLANDTSFEFDLNSISDKLADGENTLTFHPHVGALEGVFAGPYVFNNLTVNAVKAPEPVKPTYNVTADSPVEYTKGSERKISVSIAFDDAYANADLPVYVFIGSAAEGIPVQGVKANDTSFEFDLKTISDELSVGKNTISFHPAADELTAIADGEFDFAEITVNVKEEEIISTYVSTPVPDAAGYTIGDSLNITVNVAYDGIFNEILPYETMYVYINGERNADRVAIDGVRANETSFVFDLGIIADRLFEGVNNLTFHPDVDAIPFSASYTFNPLHVTAESGEVPVEVSYSSTPVPRVMNYIIGESKEITVNVVYDDIFNEDLADLAMQVYINGEDEANGVAIEGVYGNATTFKFDLARISDKLVEGVNNLTFHPSESDIPFSGPYTFNTLVVTAFKAEPQPEYLYVSTPEVSNVAYNIGESCPVTFTIEYPYGFNFDDVDICVFLDGSFWPSLTLDVDSYDKTVTLDLNDLADEFRTGHTYSVVVRHTNDMYDTNWDELGPRDCQFNALTVNVEGDIVKLNTTMDVEAESDREESADIYVEFEDLVIGNVTLFINDEEIDSKEIDYSLFAEFHVENLKEDNCTFKVIFTSDEFNTLEASGTLTIIHGFMDFYLAEEEVFVGDNITASVTLPDDATGTVTLTIGENEYSFNVTGGLMQIPVPALEEGLFTVYCSYSGDDLYLNRSSEAYIEIVHVPEPGEIVIHVPKHAEAGENANVTVSIINATGNVTVIVDGKEYDLPLDENGSAVLPLDNITAGEHNVVVIYYGNDKFNATHKVKTFNVAEEDILEPEINVTVIVDGVEYPAKVVDGKVVIDTNRSEPVLPEAVVVDGVEYPAKVVDGKVVVDTNRSESVLPEAVVVDGVEYPVEYVNGTAVVKTNKTEPDNNVTVVVDGVEYPAVVVDGKVIINTDVPVVDNNVTVVVDGVEYPAVVVDGKVIINTDVPVVDNNVTVVVDGKEYHAEIINGTVNVRTNATELVSNERLGTVILADDFEQYSCDYYAGERGGYFIAQLKDSNGNPLANRTVLIGYNGINFNRTTNETGHFAVQIGLQNAGLYTFGMSYLGDDNYNASFLVRGINIVKKPTSIVAKDKKFKVKTKTKKLTVKLTTIVGSSIDGKVYLKEGKKLILKVNGKKYKAKTDTTGKATFKIKNLNKKGIYIAKITFKGDTFVYKPSSKKIKLTVK